jgi:hypothetical protein
MLSNHKIIEYIDKDIKILKDYYQKCSARAKEQIRQKWIFTELKKLTVESNCKYLQNAYNLLKEEDLYRVEDALNYLDNIDTKMPFNKEIKIHIFKALLNELLIKYIDAAREYKKCNFDKYAMAFYKDFKKRTKEIKTSYELPTQDSTEEDIDSDLKTLEENAKSLETKAKHYSKSIHSQDLAQTYYKQALALYKKIVDLDPSFSRNYTLALIKACETYNLPKSYLEEAENLIFHTSRCKDTEFYLLNKIKTLKDKMAKEGAKS